MAENWPRFFTSILPSLAFAFLLSNFAEEVGWTGFLFDRLQGRFTPLRAAAIVAVPFALFHIPGFIVETESVVDGLVLLGVLFIPQLASRVIVAWFYNNTHRSLLIVGLFHASYNATTQSQFHEAFLPVGEDIEFLILLAVPIIPAILIAALHQGPPWLDRHGHSGSKGTEHRNEPNLESAQTLCLLAFSGVQRS